MTTTAPEAGAEVTGTRPPRPPLSVRVLRVLGWTLISAGVVVVLYLVYSLLFTNLETSAAQNELMERWTLEVEAPAPNEPVVIEEPAVEEPDAPQEPESDGSADEVDEVTADAVIDPGAATAVLEFVRPGTDARPVREDPVFVVPGVSREDLRRGPGHYPRSALPGQEGNFAVAGHRTTYGAPFFNVDELVPGDEVHATGRDGVRHAYVVRELRIVSPFDVWVVDPDPLGTGRPTLTLTTCHPRFSNAQRLIVFAELAA